MENLKSGGPNNCTKQQYMARFGMLHAVFYFSFVSVFRALPRAAGEKKAPGLMDPGA